ncbi:MAG TPA: hypothetical protein VMW85_00635 [Methanomassiliicoccales archaeon]|nr:hypothetical protein [Methanomassiliicoccales archaeon]
MFAPRSEKLEKRIKDLNALMAEYRSEMDEADKRYNKREMGQEEADRIRNKCQSKMNSIGEKIRASRTELESLK